MIAQTQSQPSPNLDEMTHQAYELAKMLIYKNFEASDIEILRISQLIVDKSQEIGVDPMLIMALIHVESTFDPCARSHRGAKGLMQVIPHRIMGEQIAAETLAFNHQIVYNPEWNIRFGSDYLGYLVKRFDELETAVAAYNAGPTRVSGWVRAKGDLIRTGYSRRVFQQMERLKRFQAQI